MYNHGSLRIISIFIWESTFWLYLRNRTYSTISFRCWWENCICPLGSSYTQSLKQVQNWSHWKFLTSLLFLYPRPLSRVKISPWDRPVLDTASRRRVSGIQPSSSVKIGNSQFLTSILFLMYNVSCSSNQII